MQDNSDETANVAAVGAGGRTTLLPLPNRANAYSYEVGDVAPGEAKVGQLGQEFGH